jgi:hypothetical protein
VCICLQTTGYLGILRFNSELSLISSSQGLSLKFRRPPRRVESNGQINQRRPAQLIGRHRVMVCSIQSKLSFLLVGVCIQYIGSLLRACNVIERQCGRHLEITGQPLMSCWPAFDCVLILGSASTKMGERSSPVLRPMGTLQSITWFARYKLCTSFC